MSTPSRSTPATPTALPVSSRSFLQAAKPQRVLACVLCQQRKLKCDREFPCSNCTRSNAHCVPAVALGTRQRRRRFPERELLERLRHYESLLRHNNIKFEPLHKDNLTRDKHDPQDDEQSATGADQSASPSTTVKSETIYEAKNFWHAMNQRAQSQNTDDGSSDSSLDDLPEAAVKEAWDELYQNSDHLLFGSQETAVEVYTLHPEQVQIFRLWQIYLDNVNPLLKVTHSPTLQPRIIDAASNVASIKPALAALMLAIYCVSILSLDEDQCSTMFASPRETLLKKYQFGCQQALLKAGFLRTDDRDCLTALYLYLISIKLATDPQSLSSMLGVAVRIAQRMGLHNEAANARWPALEAEMRRRLWWSLILFDTRICELADFRTAMLGPTWDCRVPSNFNDFDLQPEMKAPPPLQQKTSEALFAVVRGEIGEFIRHSAFHLDFVNPALKAIAKDVQGGPIPEGGELVMLEKMTEENRLQLCNSENPLQFMTIWMTRGYIAKSRLVEHYSKASSVQQTDAQRDAAIGYALRLLECDTTLMVSPLTTGYRWFIHLYFPAIAYMHLVQDLRMRPLSSHADRMWEIMSDNYDARFMFLDTVDNPFYTLFTKMILQAWAAREAVFRQSGRAPVPPRTVSDIQRRMAQRAQEAPDNTRFQLQPAENVFGWDNPDFLPPVDSGWLYGTAGQGYLGAETRPYNHILPGQTAPGAEGNDMNWNSMDWNAIYRSD